MMFRGLIVLTLLAGGLLAGSYMTASENTQLLSIGGRSGLPALDVFSFIVGIVAGGMMTTVARFPWGEIPERILAALAGWRRTFVLLSLIVVCTSVLLFY